MPSMLASRREGQLMIVVVVVVVVVVVTNEINITLNVAHYKPLYA